MIEIIIKIRTYSPRLYNIILSVVSKISNLFYFRKSIRGKNNSIIMKNSLTKNVRLKMRGNNNSVVFKNETIIRNTLIIINGDQHNLIIENNCNINNSELWILDNNCLIEIGCRTRIYGAHIAVTEPFGKIVIGKRCLFSSNIDIRNGDSHSIIDLLSNKRINYAKNITIGNNVWIGKGASILKGVTIGDNSVVGTRSLVTKSFIENSIISGFPAKVIREGIYWRGDRIN
ncbi:MAG: DapH/DapD/GlmU-related protein [Ignavibacteriaceae bacterium]